MNRVSRAVYKRSRKGDQGLLLISRNALMWRKEDPHLHPESYHLALPAARTTNVVFASPHSGRDYSAAFLRRAVLAGAAIRSSEDAFVDQLIAAAPQFGAPLLLAKAPRAFVDLNRAADELDPALIEGVRRFGHNPRIASGLGVIPRVVAHGQPIYRGKLTRAEAEMRLAQYWHPYHRQLQSLLDESRRDFGAAILVDFHSMPHEALDHQALGAAGRPDIVLGDRFGATAAPAVVAQIEAAFVRAGLRVARNVPFAGAYIIAHYGRPARGQQAIQIEIDRALYMDEQRLQPRADFADFVALMTGVVAEIAAIGGACAVDVAAE